MGARMYFAKSKQLSSLRTVCSHISNMFDGVTKKFEYRMRLVYAHFPIQTFVIDVRANGRYSAPVGYSGNLIELSNFLGERRRRVVNLLPGVKVEKSART